MPSSGFRSWALSASLAVLAFNTGGCGAAADDFACETDDCLFTRDEWRRVQGLAGLGEPPPDTSNRLVGNEQAVQLGWKFYFEKDFSGDATWVDTLGRTAPSARAPRGQRTGMSCASCHNPLRAGADTSSVPGHVSVGAGWYDVNGQQTVNAAYYDLLYWNGRSDSLWAQASAVIESGVSMNGNRLAIAWTIADKYRASYDQLFVTQPLTIPGTSAEVAALLQTPTTGVGKCNDTAGCPAGCQVVMNSETAAAACMPRFPLKGKRGTKPGCQFGDPSEPFQDAFDCMAAEDQSAITAVLMNVSKAIAAYEFQLRSRDAPFDQYVQAGADANNISDEAKRGLKLFVGRASCVDCHNTPFLSDNGFHDIGIPQTGAAVPTVADCYAGNARCDCVQGKSCLPWGYYDGMTKLKAAGNRRDSAASDDPGAGARFAGYYNALLDEAMKGQWRTPSLRDVALTGPYMHDGIFRTLDEVVWHYDQGGSATAGTGKAPELHPLYLSARDRSDLVAFLRTLTGRFDRPELHVPPMGASL